MTTTLPRPQAYAFSNRAPQAVDQLASLEAYLDPLTTGCLARVEMPPGAHCLELGAGGGSIARWLADQVGPTGTVVAVDKDTSRLLPYPSMEIRQHDLYQGAPGGGPYHLIHARLLLLHLSHRRRLLRELTELLAPGGWLVLGEFSRHPLQVLAARDEADAALFSKVMDVFADVLENGHGADLGWAHQVYPELVAAGMVDVAAVEHAESWPGGGPGAKLHAVNITQKEDALLAAGLSAAELDEFRRIVADPAFCARSWQFVCTLGRRP